MPATPRTDMMRLTSARATSINSFSDYLSRQSPALLTLQFGLGLLALYVAVRLSLVGVRRFYNRDEHPCLSPTTSNFQRSAFGPSDSSKSYPNSLQLGHQSQATGTMDEKHRSQSRPGAVEDGDDGGLPTEQRDILLEDGLALPEVHQPLVADARSAPGGKGSMPRQIFARPPPAPPLTPPELSSTIFTVEAGPKTGDSFMHQPNPDYMSATTSFQDSSQASPIIPRRRSYTRTIPIGSPMPRPQSSGSEEAVLTLSPSSYPSSSPMLPPAPSLSDNNARPEVHGEIEMHGEIISALNAQGAGWMRHTRVYGGGACLACAAAGRKHGEGGFYGATVRPEEMR